MDWRTDGWICFGVLEVVVGIYPEELLPGKERKVSSQCIGREAWKLVVKLRSEGGLDSCDYWN